MTSIIIIHSIAMAASLTLMGAAVGLGIFGKKSAATLATGSVAVTFIGGVSGFALLLSAPLSVECAALTAYLVAIATLYVSGFAMGDARSARLIRSSVKNS